MNAEKTRLARQLLGLNQTDFAALLGWTSKRNIVNLERGDKEVTTQTALAIECLLRRNNKFGDFEMLNELANDVETQKQLAIKAMGSTKEMTIKITDELCAVCFKKYAKEEVWNEKGNEFQITFEDSDSVAVSKEDFLEYQFQFTDFAIGLENKYANYIDELREAQRDAAESLLET